MPYFEKEFKVKKALKSGLKDKILEEAIML